ncbi:MAG: cyanophycinase [Bryobacterales bacterium]|nr:cyanophycinase [Bryobacterales bacterium]
MGKNPEGPKGSLLLIGGHEKKKGEMKILQQVAERARDGRLVVATIASEEPQPQWEEYRQVFEGLGVRDVLQLDGRQRDELIREEVRDVLTDARAVFFAGGDQMKITSRFGGTPACDGVRELYLNGGLVAGTSSGASVLSEVMMAGGASDSSHEIGDSLELSAGLGLLTGVIIDQHFAERGRIGRLLGAIARNARLLGIGIDEDTAMLIDKGRSCRVLGSGAIYIVDAREMTYTSLDASVMSAFGFRVHVLSAHDHFDLETRVPEAESVAC